MKKIVSICWFFSICAVQANEGLWLVHQTPLVTTPLQQQGIITEPQPFADISKAPLQSVIDFNQCSAVFLSSQGLFLTDYRCAMRHQTENLQSAVLGGFLARSPAAERPLASTSSVRITLAVHNVTQAILQEIEAQAQGQERLEQIEAVKHDIIEQCEAEEGYRCDVHSTFGGLEYYLTKQLELRDVRLVYAPAASVALFALPQQLKGVASSLWPFHAADFSLFRAYVGKDGKPADYHLDNIPYTPTAFAKLARNAVRPGDAILTAGYPVSSHRHLSAGELRLQFDRLVPAELAYKQRQLQRLTELVGHSTALKQHYEPRLNMLSVQVVEAEQQLHHYHGSGLLDEKLQLEQQFTEWLAQEPSRTARYLPAVKTLQQYVGVGESGAELDVLLSHATDVQLFAMADAVVSKARGQHKETHDAVDALQRSFSLGDPDIAAVDLELAIEWLRAYASLPAEQRSARLDDFFQLTQGFNEQSVRTLLTPMYRDSVFASASGLEELASLSADEFAASTDPVLKMALIIGDSMRQRQLQRLDEQVRWQVAQPRYMAGMLAFHKSHNRLMYPDANGDLRVSFGTIRGYSPADGVYAGPFSTTYGIAQRHTGIAPFVASDTQRLAIKSAASKAVDAAHSGALAVSFLSTADSLSDYAGGATFNTQGELVGMQVQGSTGGALADYGYDASIHRSIHLDSRFVLWQLEQVDAASQLVQEIRSTFDE